MSQINRSLSRDLEEAKEADEMENLIVKGTVTRLVAKLLAVNTFKIKRLELSLDNLVTIKMMRYFCPWHSARPALRCVIHLSDVLDIQKSS